MKTVDLPSNHWLVRSSASFNNIQLQSDNPTFLVLCYQTFYRIHDDEWLKRSSTYNFYWNSPPVTIEDCVSRSVDLNALRVTFSVISTINKNDLEELCPARTYVRRYPLFCDLSTQVVKSLIRNLFHVSTEVSPFHFPFYLFSALLSPPSPYP